MAAEKNKKNPVKPGARVKGFFKGVVSELKKVHWPDRKQLVTYTGVVIVFVLVMSVAISVVDWIVSSLFGLVLG